ncbi:molybdopterin-dependent oxidoreductase [Planomonospora sp. ID91781]|uniref:molybdopterin-dependent oxidoreductase n=1 Tax=Planomonospora sp. ID91781 TaxID=2738135 RepID=UPI0018C3A736|nr:molybdopterin-dependent oxidoreductase [Planomonospora sp. ID91781]MBG0821268.1 molybdopterin-dependent oxidoreductase [Planomonospora sp. ID91781]
MESNGRAPAWAAALIGLVAGAVAVGVSLPVAALVKASAFPVVAVGDAAVDLAPAWLKEWAIRAFGENDKTVLLAGVLAVLAAGAAATGALAVRDLRYGLACLAAFGAVGLLAVLTRPGASPGDALPTLLGAAAGMSALSRLLRRALVPAPPVPGPAVMRAGEDLRSFDRRGLLTAALGGVAVAGIGGAAGRLLSGGAEADAVRSGVVLPRPAVPARPVPAGSDLRISGLSPFFTPNRDFYRVDTALLVPRVDPRDWTLTITGMVDRPAELTFADLMGRPLVEADVTLCCVSNEVGGPYIGNARWLGVRLADVLREAGVHAGADMLLSTSTDGWTCGTPADVVLDGREALLAVAMNGETLTADHGFPARLVVPGLYGYVSATKWVTEIKVTRFDRDEAYWTPRGWSAKGPIKTQSRIDLPRPGAVLPPGRTVIAGVAWAQHRGVDAVEVRVDGGPWRRARLAEAPTADTWRQWVLDDWDAAAGEHTIEVRATDATGRTQTAERAPVAPDGATGLHAVTVRVA